MQTQQQTLSTQLVALPIGNDASNTPIPAYPAVNVVSTSKYQTPFMILVINHFKSQLIKITLGIFYHITNYIISYHMSYQMVKWIVSRICGSYTAHHIMSNYYHTNTNYIIHHIKSHLRHYHRHHQPTNDKKQSTIDNRQSTINNQQPTNSHQWTINNQELTINNQQSTTNNHTLE